MERKISVVMCLILSMGFVFAADDSGMGSGYTANFYIAMGLVVLALIVAGFFGWLWIRGPKNKWDK